MANPSHMLFVISLCVSVTLLNPFTCYANYYFFIFGDSLYDPGNNQYVSQGYIPAYHKPYGTTFFNHSTGRFSDGRVVPDFIAANLNLSFIPPYLEPGANFTNGASFASAGAGVLDTNPEAAELGDDEASKRLASAVYLISMAGDDYFAYITKYPNSTQSQQLIFIDSVLDNFTKYIKDIYNIGGRKFMIQTVAPIGCLPMMKQTYSLSLGDACAGRPLTLAKLHNSQLVIALEELQTNLTGSVFSLFDYHRAMGDRIDNPAKFGFKEGGVACCGTGSHRADSCGEETGDYEVCFNPHEYVFFDGGHNTEKANYQMADLMWTGGPDNMASPHTIKDLFDLEILPTATTKISSRKSVRGFNNQERLCVSVTLLNPFTCYADNYFFILGDSLYDVGNNQYIVEPGTYLPQYHKPYGTTFLNHATGRYSDGRAPPDFIASKLNMSFIPPILEPEADFTNGASFASGGASVFDTSTQAIYFGKQVELFKKLSLKWKAELGEEEANKRLANAVYLISICGNDYFRFSTNFPHSNQSEQLEYIDTVLVEFKKEIKNMYNIGGRKFMIQNVSPLGCLPRHKEKYNISTDVCAGRSLVLTKLHNSQLIIALEELKSSLTGSVFSHFDYHKATGDRINDPAKYGFKEGGTACCGVGSHRGSGCGDVTNDYELCFNPNEYVWFDGAHHSDKANGQLAELMWNGGPDNVVSPHTIKDLFDLEILPAATTTT
ncbi:hypothetical protein EZV62_003146 [Acer yangbiense]|uniref:SGNH hydrolase-type esterase domain-containing protein n=1 Tax=Acer yangbiense TaxID=1000413 RepID=A0A5C7IGE3_9ROSI|nr:hypothetical protein EZV62_003146 [Acer yangbiense]